MPPKLEKKKENYMRQTFHFSANIELNLSINFIGLIGEYML